MPSPRQRILSAIVSEPPSQFVSDHLIERIPYLFWRREKGYADWRRCFGKDLGVDPGELTLVGSAATGVSLNPNKNFKLFRADSDIDVAVISVHHFDVAWRWLRTLGSARYRLPIKVQNAVKDHVNRYVYWGAITTDRLLPHVPFGGQWLPALNRHSADSPFDGREIKVRLYRDWAALRDYHVRNARKLQRTRLSGT